MAENIVINGTTYEGVHTIKVKNTNGEDVDFSLPNSSVTVEEWQPNPTWWDIKTILENDTRDYSFKAIYLYTDSTIAESGLWLNGQAYATSDGAFYDYGTIVTAFNHTWDLSKDKPCYIDGVEAYKTRYIIVYSNGYAAPLNKQKNLLWVYGINTSSVADMSSMFYNCYSLQTVPELDTSSATKMSGMFNSCYSLQTIPELDTSSATNMASMFSTCYSLKSIPELDTSSVTDMSSMFHSCYSLKSIPELDTNSVANMSSMFYGCRSLQTVPELDTSSVANMSSLFNQCHSLISVSKLNTSSVTNMSQMFNNCSSLQSIPELDTSSATNMSNMFNSCYLLISVPKLNTSSVTNMSQMFNNCSSLPTIPELDTSSVTDMSNLFNQCYSLQTIPELDTSSVTKINYMFNNCYSLKSIPKLDIISAENITGAFSKCSSLVNLKLYNIKTSGLTIGSGTSYGNLLSQESLIHTIKQLWDYSSSTSSYTLTMGNSNTPKLANVYVKLITATDEMIAEDPNINSKMPCEVCESTDEGAMLILDYATAKGWTIS